MRWLVFDLTRTVASVCLVVLVLMEPDRTSPAVVALGTFVATGLLVSLFLRPTDQQ